MQKQNLLDYNGRRLNNSVYKEEVVKTLNVKSIQYTYQSLYINILCLSVCLSKINVKTAEPIGPKCFMVTHMTPRKLNNLKNCVDIF